MSENVPASNQNALTDYKEIAQAAGAKSVKALLAEVADLAKDNNSKTPEK